MNHPKTVEEQLSEAYSAGFKANQLETELLRKRVEKLRSALREVTNCDLLDAKSGKLNKIASEALSGDKASEGGV